MSSPQTPSKSPASKIQLTPREKAEKVLAAVFDPVDVIGKAVMGDLWKTFYESVQDAIALSLLLQIPSLIGKWILGKEFSGFDVCMRESPFGVNRYACFIIVTSDLCLWIVLAGRVISRFLSDLNQLLAKKGGQRVGKP
ncbi:hypothetical protein [Coleofasciculus sp. FACHB-SPT9]|uniref:hypothetical protein n=1 Tax=Cyanophyceae TaxID=3028117 RepID=UPI00168437BC|nr:hypothetical protein [Coleofasciculus sp. FACHB-SPT9]MBD1890638.1 hypothetical protein [Coleofasciculus sp. FACHB-SPT9]